MNTARIVVLGIALAAGGVAAFLASGSDPLPVPVVAPVEQRPTDDVLVARADIGLGQTINPDDLQWQDWPNASSSTFIRRQDRPEAMQQLAGYIARSPFVAGEPIRESKLVKGNGSGFMAYILPAGMRAVSTEISPENSAGGFILPNDRVDIIQTRREKSTQPGQNDVVVSEIILDNVRVLAIDQQVEEKNGLKVVVGKTATVELKPEQAETLARARQGGSTLSLALRSVLDANVTSRIDEGAPTRGKVNIIRRGVTSTTTTTK